MCQIVHVTIHFYDRYSELNFVSFYTICSFLLVDGNRDRVKAEYQILWSLFSIAFRLLGSRRTLEFSKVMFFSVWTVILFIGKKCHPSILYQRISCSDSCAIDRACSSWVWAKEGYNLDKLPIPRRPNTDTTIHATPMDNVLSPVTMRLMLAHSGWKLENQEGTRGTGSQSDLQLQRHCCCTAMLPQKRFPLNSKRLPWHFK